MNAPESPRHRGIAGRIAAVFIGSRLTPLVIIASVLLGVGAVLLLPREEEPQIVVPMVDVFVRMPGASANEVENRVTRPMEKLLWEIPGVEYVYSTTSPGTKVPFSASIFARTLSATAIALVPLRLATERVTAGCAAGSFARAAGPVPKRT